MDRDPHASGAGKERRNADSQLSISKQSNDRWRWIEEHKEAMRQR